MSMGVRGDERRSPSAIPRGRYCLGGLLEFSDNDTGTSRLYLPPKYTLVIVGVVAQRPYK